LGQIALYAGSFDPITLGHLDVVRRTARLFDRVIVAVGNNPAKRYFFELQERQRLVSEVCRGLDGVEVHTFEGLLVDACRDHGAEVIVRGLRSGADFDVEFRYGLANRSLTGVETVFLCADPAHLFVSSSIVKEVAMHGGDVSAMVPPVVLRAIRDRQEG
jgi:pantetheine-phosphate adenylyltransferase